MRIYKFGVENKLKSLNTATLVCVIAGIDVSIMIFWAQAYHFYQAKMLWKEPGHSLILRTIVSPWQEEKFWLANFIWSWSHSHNQTSTQQR